MTRQNKKVSQRELRQQKLAQEQRKRRTMIIIPIVVGIIALGTFAYIRLRPVEGTIDYGAQERGHDTESTFASTGLPPRGGDHAPQW